MKTNAFLCYITDIFNLITVVHYFVLLLKCCVSQRSTCPECQCNTCLILERTKLNTFLHVTDSLKGCAKLCKDISRGTQAISLFIKGSISHLTKTAVKCLQWLWKEGCVVRKFKSGAFTWVILINKWTLMEQKNLPIFIIESVGVSISGDSVTLRARCQNISVLI